MEDDVLCRAAQYRFSGVRGRTLERVRVGSGSMLPFATSSFAGGFRVV